MYNFNLLFLDSYEYGNTKSYHVTSNYSLEDITNAYEEASKLIQFNFIGYCYGEYEDFYIDEEASEILVKYNIIRKEDLYKTLEYGNAYYIKDSTTVINIFTAIVRLVLKDFELKERDSDETTLNLLEYYKWNHLNYITSLLL